ncbi:MAG TPA: carbohydrate ABC transporter permease [Piscinibacter sp.]|uniref:carbohydrate ABC transporter permease n=1 Tax=Piscinibacter sp. TaxID=1903157 RepID=UPI001B4C9CE6|nr:carbohydrate ABC transporter permease [Piscinibacter sp.]MBK7533310.1 carbohydrate ABC transporter permease [Piscinibacter sp.]MBL0092535.1 carbohydrate ABC transporter permease [Piscinibacter sp.]MBP6543434.1 carbohydrate ABC transporter permease [Piscinibacter sp.]HOY36357.1 carbohydrate ABC transporter permease [Piscinibacter sp.]HPG78755.1 carbohydrate ABC transporter permease [Piscinibacter sp.]
MLVTALTPQRLIAYGIVAIGAVLMLGPFYFMFVFATHTNREILSMPPPLWFGSAFLDNLDQLLRSLPHFWKNVGWSVYVALMSTVLNLFFCSLAGFAFAMYDFKWREGLFAMVMATMLLPSFVGMIPTALTMSWLEWMNQPRALYVPGAVGALGIFMMRQYIESAIPRELIDAARIDGCGEFAIYWRVVLPLIGPALGTLGLITFIGSWNNFIGPLIVIRDMEMYTVPLALRSLQGTGQIPWGAISAGSAIAVLPLLVLFMLASRRLIEGLTAGAVKA